MTVKVRTIHTSIPNLTIYGDTTSAAHSCTIYHDWIQGNDCRDCIRFSYLRNKFHHRDWTNRNDHIIFLSGINLFLQHVGNKTFLSICAVIGTEEQVVTALPEFVFQNDNILAPETSNDIYLFAHVEQLLCLRIRNCTSNATANNTNRFYALRNFGCHAQRSYQVQNGIASVQSSEPFGRMTDNLENQRNRSGFPVIIGNRQRNTFSVLVNPENDKLSR